MMSIESCSRRAGRIAGRLTWCTLVLASAASVALGQANDASVTGSVTDTTGAVLVGALVRAVHTETGVGREVPTGPEGTYAIERLPPGTYTVTAQLAGFEPARVEDVRLADGARHAITIELRVARLTETVTTVYGEKTSRDIRDTPASVGVVSGARIEAAEMFRVEDVFRQIANVNHADWVDSGIVLRGINSEGIGGPSGSPLATTYVDGVPQTMAGARRGVNGTWDLQQVEVWRGPQSTVVGRNALAGAIQLRSNDPTMAWESAARLGFGSGTLNNQAATVSGPIVEDRLAFRVAAEQQSRHGEVSYPSYSGLPRIEQRADDSYWMTRGKVLYRPSRDSRTTLLATMSSSYDSPSLNDVDGPSAGVTYEDRVWGLQTLPIFVEARATRNTFGILDATFALSDRWTLRSMTSYITTDTERPSVDLASDGAVEDTQVTQEVILSYQSDRSETVLGAFFLDGRSANSLDQARPWESFVRQNRSVSDVWNAAAYADTRWRVTGPWTVLAGFRLDREQRDFASTNSQLSDDFVLTTSTSATGTSFTVPLPKVGLAYDLSEVNTVAFVAQRAYRAGGSAINFVTSTPYEFDPEYAWNYELSWRGQILRGGLLQYRLNLFRMNWRDQQINVPQVPGDFTSDLILNAGRSTVQGAEVEVTWTAGGGLSLYSALGIADTEFKEFAFVQAGELRDLAGEPFPQAPGITANLGGQYQHRSGLFVGADATYRGGSLSRSLLEAGLRDELPGYALAHVRGGWTRGIWRLSWWADNLFDTTYFRYRYDDPRGLQLATLGRGRLAGANLSVAF